MYTNNFFTETSCCQQNCKQERICGDTFLFRRIDGGSRSIAVLSDGMGHGVKANILSTLTSSIVVNFDYRHNDIRSMATMILKSLPVCAIRKTSYSTFSIVEVNHNTGYATIIEYDNPRSIIFRNHVPLNVPWESVTFEQYSNDKRNRAIVSTSFKIQDGDRIVVMSDGVTQSGLGTDAYPFGWGRKNVEKFIQSVLQTAPAISSADLAGKVLAQAVSFDNFWAHDDISCAVIYIRPPQSLLLCSCPPALESDHPRLIENINRFKGKKIICGYHLARLIAELTDNPIIKDTFSLDYDVQPAWHMRGVDLVTESLVTLNKVYDMLQNNESPFLRKGPAAEVGKMMLKSDEIEIILGTNHGNGGLYMVDEYELRRKVMRHIARILEKKYMKEVNIKYI